MSERDTSGQEQSGIQEPSFAEAMSEAMRKTALGQVRPGQTPTAGALLGAIGGVRGLVESILPGLMFLVVFTITRELVLSVLTPLGVSLVFIAVRLVTRQKIISALAGAAGIGISAAFALVSGRAEDNFVPGFLVNVLMIAVMLLSVAVRRPLIGVVVGLLTSDFGWRSNPARYRVALVATLLWAALPTLRLGVQVPFYLAQNVSALAGIKLVMGVPLYAALLWVTWLLVRSAWSSRVDSTGSD